MARIVKRKVVSATLMETLVSLVILMMVFTTATSVCLNSIKSLPGFQKLKAESLIDSLILESSKESSIENFSILIGDFLIEQKVELSAFQDVYEIQISASKDEKSLAKRVLLYPAYEIKK